METTIYHVTRIANGGVYGHESKCCDPSGCSGFEQFLSKVSADDVTVAHEYEIADDGSVIAEIDDWDDGVTTGYRLVIRANEWAGALSADGRHPLISGTINQTNQCDEDASTFDTRKEAERALASLITCEVITAEQADMVEIEEVDRE